MNSELVYLRPNVQVEPLVDQWYAWPHLIPPATNARNITERHMPIMNSYISAPQVHAKAAQNPKLLGGPFVDYGGRRVDEIRRLRDETLSERQQLAHLSAALGELDTMLQTQANGYSLQPLYEHVPPCLRGYVELTYDLNNHVSYRLLEPLLYKSPYYQRQAQSLMLSFITGDDRPFVLSTPRLTDDRSVHIRVPFDDERIDRLFDAKYAPQPRQMLRDLFEVPAGSETLYDSFFTTEPPPPYQPYDGPSVRWRYFGHACILIESQGVSMLFDPVLSYTYETNISRYTYLDLPPSIDYVLITHNHQDHVLFETLLQLRPRIKNLIVPRNGHGALQDPSLRLLLEACGFPRVIEMNEMESLPIPGGAITGLPFFGEHSDLQVSTKLAYLIRLHGHSLMFAADSCNIEPRLYDHIHRETGDVDALFLGMECDGAPLTWLYGPLLTKKIERAMDESRRLNGSNYEQGMHIVNRFGCKAVYVYAMGQEPWLNHVMRIKYTDQSRPIVDSNRLMEECRSRDISAERLFGEREILLP